MGRNYAAIPHDYLEEMEQLTDEEFGRLVRGLLRYSMTGEEIAPVGNERFYVKRVKNAEDNFQNAFDETDRKKTERAKKAAEARWNNTKASTSMHENAQASLSMHENACDAKNKYNINKININKPNKEKNKKESAFALFWEAYPKKVGKQAAFKAFEKVKGVSIEKMLEAIEAQKHSRQWQKDDGQYIPNPATWLNQGRWDDRIDVVEPKGDGRVPVDHGDLDWLLSTTGETAVNAP